MVIFYRSFCCCGRGQESRALAFADLESFVFFFPPKLTNIEKRFSATMLAFAAAPTAVLVVVVVFFFLQQLMVLKG